MSSGSAGSIVGSAPGRAGRDRRLLVVLALLVLALAVVVNRGWHAYQAYRRLDAARAAPGVRDPRDVPIQAWLPVRIVARNHRVPESVLLDGLREAGFTVQPQDTVPDLPGPLRGALPPPQTGRLLPPDRQSLRQIAWYSHRDPSEAVRVAEEAIGTYRQAHPLPPRPPGPPGRPGGVGAPVAPPAGGGQGGSG